MAESISEKAIREAEEACTYAYQITPEAYRHFITLIGQGKRVGGSRQSPIYANIRLPYMTAAGRIQMARDEHQDQNAILDMRSEFISVGDVIVCSATIKSTLRGIANGHATVGFGGSNVDSTSPVENAETSAWGRALGALGYGLFGTGIASANEMLAVINANKDQDEDRPVPDMTGATSDTGNIKEPASKAQMGMLYGILVERGIKEGHKRALIAKVMGDEPAKGRVSFELDTLTKCENLSQNWIRAYIQLLISENGKTIQEVGEHMQATYGTNHAVSLTKDKQKELIAWLAPSKPEQPAESHGEQDIYDPGVPVAPKKAAKKAAKAPDWRPLVLAVCEGAKVSATVLSDWAIAKWGKGTERGIAELDAAAFEALVEMSYEAIKADINKGSEAPQAAML